MLAYYGTAISDHITKKPSGGIICTDVPIARTGTQDYFAQELKLGGDPERVVQVAREPEEVFAASALASFEGCPVTDGHPPENITAESFGAYARGHAQNIRRSGEYVIADLHIDDAALASDVLNNIKRQVSCGYVCTYEPSGGGYVQKGILGNHIAIVPMGRAGASVSIKDSAREAGKGREYMSKFTQAVLSALGMAAREAKTDEEMAALVSTTATVLDADPSAKSAAGEKPAAPAAVAAEDVMVERVPKGDDLGSKLDRVLELLEGLRKEGHKEERMHDETDLDAALKKLAGEEDGEKAVVIPADEVGDACASPAAKDAAAVILRTMRPIVASIEDKAVRAQVADAVLSAVQDAGKLGTIDAAATASAKSAADQAVSTSYERRCADSQAAYAARNPHKRQEKEV